ETALNSDNPKARFLDGIDLLARAIRLDPAFVDAYYQMARGHDLLYVTGFDRSFGRLALAEAAINIVRRLAPDAADGGQLRGVTIAVTGKIESSGGIPWITIKSMKQIVLRTASHPDYLKQAMDKQANGDPDGAIADLDRAIELTHEPSLYIQRAEIKVKKDDLEGAISDYDQLIERHPQQGVFYLSRARLKMKKRDYEGAVADCDLAIAGMPEQRDNMMRTQAYSARAEAEKAKDKIKHAQDEAERPKL
ncbi:MAG: tetratricopeptide repeat protein, partial [Chthoniobacterales bacterium]